MQTKILRLLVALVFLGGAGFFGFKLFDTLRTAEIEREQLAHIDEQVIEKLIKIRESQKKYFEANNHYASDWDSLITFVREGELPVIQRKEEIFVVNGKDSIKVTVDTLRVDKVYDLLKEDLGYSKENLGELAYTPVSHLKFELWSEDMGGQHLMEVKDPKPLNTDRAEDPLRIGSREIATTKGNWE